MQIRVTFVANIPPGRAFDYLLVPTNLILGDIEGRTVERSGGGVATGSWAVIALEQLRARVEYTTVEPYRRVAGRISITGRGSFGFDHRYDYVLEPVVDDTKTRVTVTGPAGSRWTPAPIRRWMFRAWAERFRRRMETWDPDGPARRTPAAMTVGQAVALHIGTCGVMVGSIVTVAVAMGVPGAPLSTWWPSIDTPTLILAFSAFTPISIGLSLAISSLAARSLPMARVALVLWAGLWAVAGWALAWVELEDPVSFVPGTAAMGFIYGLAALNLTRRPAS